MPNSWFFHINTHTKLTADEVNYYQSLLISFKDIVLSADSDYFLEDFNDTYEQDNVFCFHFPWNPNVVKSCTNFYGMCQNWVNPVISVNKQEKFIYFFQRVVCQLFPNKFSGGNECAGVFIDPWDDYKISGFLTFKRKLMDS